MFPSFLMSKYRLHLKSDTLSDTADQMSILGSNRTHENKTGLA